METIRFSAHKRYWHTDETCRLAQPFPIKSMLPGWYKSLARYCPAEGDQFPSRTVKMCPPFLEAMVHGYALPAPFDFAIDFNPKENAIVQELPSDIDPKEFDLWKPVLDFRIGAPLKPMVLICRSYWRIETPPGYSCLFIEPLNRNVDELPFQVLSQCVQTDSCFPVLKFYLVPRVSFPIEVQKGTPLIQVIPIKRETWELKTIGLNPDEIDEIKGFREEYWSCKNRQFDERADPTNPEHGYGAYNKLVKEHSRFQ